MIQKINSLPFPTTGEIHSVDVGSHTYNLNSNKSDYDIIHIDLGIQLDKNRDMMRYFRTENTENWYYSYTDFIHHLENGPPLLYEAMGLLSTKVKYPLNNLFSPDIYPSSYINCCVKMLQAGQASKTNKDIAAFKMYFVCKSLIKNNNIDFSIIHQKVMSMFDAVKMKKATRDQIFEKMIIGLNELQDNTIHFDIFKTTMLSKYRKFLIDNKENIDALLYEIE